MNKQTELEEHQLKLEAVLTKIKKIEDDDGFSFWGGDHLEVEMLYEEKKKLESEIKKLSECLNYFKSLYLDVVFTQVLVVVFYPTPNVVFPSKSFIFRFFF